jgi:transcriptional regulator of arginine metabolism
MATLSPRVRACEHRAVRVDGSLGKAERQKLVLSLVGRMRLGTQQELLEALAAAGCRVTQATVSRDITELRLRKKTDPLGRQRYVVPGRDRRHDPRTTLRSLLAQFGRKATAAQNIVVVRCEIGSAPAIARALDQTGHPLVLGTLAGDDTLLVITASNEAAATLAVELG